MKERKALNFEEVKKKAEFSLLCSAFLSLAEDLLEEERKVKEKETLFEVKEFEKVTT
jgi:hypothetical protein